MHMLQVNSSVTQIIKQFPHMTAYNGLMIQQSFVRMTSLEQRVDMANILLKCILLNRHVLNDIEDEYIQGALVVFRELMVRGCKRLKEDDSMSVEEIQAAPLIRWVEVVICFAMNLKDFLDIKVYSLKSHSSRNSVNNLLNVFDKVDNAERRSLISNGDTSI
ncbi:uncharacterized protein LOC131429085 [Malaya genurostris]|uniref:uncharacterized protein LOC131429085 n=1 Tax=Malaya genurostris TaxID=325434 RepID=UPI0026F3BD9B|nr:uncharacterized protein LOC131429085 [Malaya genurostris]